MTTLKDAMILKMSPFPVEFVGTPVVLDSDRTIFPNRNQWRGDYTSSLPIIDSRRAGYRQVVDYSMMNINNKKYKLPINSFQTGPSTTFSPWLKAFDTDAKQNIFIGATV